MSQELQIAILIGLVMIVGFNFKKIFLDDGSLTQRIVALEVEIDHMKRLNAIEAKLK